jgi:Nucleotidyl transferase AbiEii toxin, Type IV TA system
VNRLEAALRRAADDLNKSRRPWALVGGFAVSARAEPRFTSDVDIAVMVDADPAAEDLVHSLIGDGYVVFSTIEHDNGRLATARMTKAFDGIDVVIDLLFASSGIEPEVAQAAEVLRIVPGLTLPVATIGHLIALKVLARDDVNRPQDLADLHALLRAAVPADLALARASVDLIEARGFNRSRNLRESLDLLAASLGH